MRADSFSRHYMLIGILMTKPYQHWKYCPPRAWCQTNTCWEKEQNGRFLKNPVSINQDPSVCLGFGCLASGHGDSQMCNEKRKPGSGQQQCLWEHFKCSEHSGTNEKGCSLRRDEGRMGTPLWSVHYIRESACVVWAHREAGSGNRVAPPSIPNQVCLFQSVLQGLGMGPGPPHPPTLWQSGNRTAKHPNNKNIGSLRTAKSTIPKMFLPIAHPMMAVPMGGRRWTFMHGELIRGDGEEGSVISIRLLPLP